MTTEMPNKETEAEEAPSHAKRLLWFVLIWAASIAALAGVVGLLRLILNFLYNMDSH